MKMNKTLRQELSEVMGIVGYVQKDGKNQAQSYRYASAEAVLKKVNHELSARGIAVESKAEVLHFTVNHYETKGKSRDGSEFVKQNFRSDAVVKLSLTMTRDLIFVDKEGNTNLNREDITVEGVGASTDLGDKAIMKANTAAIKYCLTNAFLISWGDDPEASPDGDVPADPKPKAKAKKATKKSAPAAAEATENTTKKSGFKRPDKF